MKKNHLFSIITAGMLTITLLAGCGNTGSNANADTGSNTNTVQESTEDQASAELSLIQKRENSLDVQSHSSRIHSSNLLIWLQESKLHSF